MNYQHPSFCKFCSCFALAITIACLSTLHSADAMPPIVSTLPDGIKLLVQQDQGSQLVAITVIVRAGSAQENEDDAGIGSMVADAILTGTSNQNADTMAASIGAIGGNVKAIWQPDLTQIRALVLPSQFQDAVYLLSDVLKNADFSQDSVDNARVDLLARIQERTDDVFDSTNDQLRASLYSGTAYSLPQIGTIDTIKRLTAADLRTYFERYYRPGNITIAIVGNIDPSQAESVVAGDLVDFIRPSTRHVEQITVPKTASGTAPLIIKQYRGDVTAGLMLLGYLAPGVGTSDYPAMVLTNALLGGMKTSLMFNNLRSKDGLAYEVASTYNAQVAVSDVTGYILYSLNPSTPVPKKSNQTSVVKDEMLAQFKALEDAPPTIDDLTRAKKFVIGSDILAHERVEDRSYLLAYADFAFKDIGGYRYDQNYADLINSVTPADIQRVAKKYFGGPPVISLLLPGDPNAGVISE
jgi:zinc protease